MSVQAITAVTICTLMRMASFTSAVIPRMRYIESKQVFLTIVQLYLLKRREDVFKRHWPVHFESVLTCSLHELFSSFPSVTLSLLRKSPKREAVNEQEVKGAGKEREACIVIYESSRWGSPKIKNEPTKNVRENTFQPSGCRKGNRWLNSYF
jgi:hypothetical protein